MCFRYFIFAHITFETSAYRLSLDTLATSVSFLFFARIAMFLFSSGVFANTIQEIHPVRKMFFVDLVFLSNLFRLMNTTENTFHIIETNLLDPFDIFLP